MMIYYKSQSRIHKIHNNHGWTTIMNWFRRTCKESKTTLYYWLYTMIIMQFTGLLNIHICFSFLLLYFSFKTRLIYWPWEPAKEMRQNDPPEKPASKIRHESLPDLCATKTRRIYSPEKPATSTRGLLATDPPSPLRIPRQDPARHPSPPPSNSVNGEGGRGQKAGPAHPRILNRYSYFHSLFMNGNIFLYDTTYTYSA